MPVTNPLKSIMDANLASVQLSHDLLEIQRALITDRPEDESIYDLLRPIQTKLSEVTHALNALCNSRLAVAPPQEIKEAVNVNYKPISKL